MLTDVLTDPTEQIDRRCLAVTQDASNFIISGRRGIPLDASRAIATETTFVDLIPAPATALISRGDPAWAETLAPAPVAVLPYPTCSGLAE